MEKINIQNGESISLAFEIDGIDLIDLIDFSVYVGANKFSISESTITVDTVNERLFYVRIPSYITARMAGVLYISYAIVTDFLGVYKENKIAVLNVIQTNENTSLPNTSEFVSITFPISINNKKVTTNVILQQIYRAGDPGAIIANIDGGNSSTINIPSQLIDGGNSL